MFKGWGLSLSGLFVCRAWRSCCLLQQVHRNADTCKLFTCISLPTSSGRLWIQSFIKIIKMMKLPHLFYQNVIFKRPNKHFLALRMLELMNRRDGRGKGFTSGQILNCCLFTRWSFFQDGLCDLCCSFVSNLKGICEAGTPPPAVSCCTWLCVSQVVSVAAVPGRGDHVTLVFERI